MPAFPKPRFAYDYDVDVELAALRAYPDQPGREDRRIPAKSTARLLVATWNIANLGLQQRRDKDYRLIAEIIRWFDLVALQEVNDNLAGLDGISAHLPGHYGALFNDAGGNRERFAFVYDTTRVTPREEMGEVTVAAAELPNFKLPDIPARF